jgi:hypothetical protein
VLYEGSALLHKTGELPTQSRLLFEQLDFAVLYTEERCMLSRSSRSSRRKEKLAVLNKETQRDNYI